MSRTNGMGPSAERDCSGTLLDDMLNLGDVPYYELYERNYQVAYAAGDTFCKEQTDWESSAEPVLELLERTGRLPEAPRLLDVGCGDGNMALVLARAGYLYTGVDVSPSAIQRARERAAVAGVHARFIHADALHLSSALDECFDVVLDLMCYHMLILDQDRREYLRQLHERLTDTGRLLLLDAYDERIPQEQVDSFAKFCGERPGLLKGVRYQPRRRRLFRWRRPGKLYIVCRPVTQAQYVAELRAAGYVIEYSKAYGTDRPCGLTGFIARKAAAR